MAIGFYDRGSDSILVEQTKLDNLMHDVPAAPPKPQRDWAYFLDFDGTLVDIAEQPDAVRVKPDLVELLQDLELATGGAVVLVSGRSIASLDRFLTPLRLRAAGLHGLEYRLQCDGAVERSGDLDSALDRVRPQLAAFVSDQDVIQLEDKGASIALHYRRAPDKRESVRAVAEAACEALGPDFTCLAGKMVYEIKPRKAHKGQVLEKFMSAPPFHGKHPVFVGDDVTDEDGFRACNEHGGTSVRVGALDGGRLGGDGAKTAANYSLPAVDDVMAWLGQLDNDVVGLTK